MTKPQPTPDPLPGVFRDSADRAVHIAAGHVVKGAIIYEFGAAFQVCSCGTKIHVSQTDSA